MVPESPSKVHSYVPGIVLISAQTFDLVKYLSLAPDDPSTAEISAVTVTFPAVAEFGVRSMYVPSVVVRVSTPPPTSLHEPFPYIFKTSLVVLKYN